MTEERNVLGLSAIRRNRGITLDQIADATNKGSSKSFPAESTTPIISASMRAPSITMNPQFWRLTARKKA
jgi:hypothetical protein